MGVLSRRSGRIRWTSRSGTVSLVVGDPNRRSQGRDHRRHHDGMRAPQGLESCIDQSGLGGAVFEAPTALQLPATIV